MIKKYLSDFITILLLAIAFVPIHTDNVNYFKKYSWIVFGEDKITKAKVISFVNKDMGGSVWSELKINYLDSINKFTKYSSFQLTESDSFIYIRYNTNKPDQFITYNSLFVQSILLFVELCVILGLLKYAFKLVKVISRLKKFKKT